LMLQLQRQTPACFWQGNCLAKLLLVFGVTTVTRN